MGHDLVTTIHSGASPFARFQLEPMLDYVILVMGQTGSGKTSLLNFLGNLDMIVPYGDVSTIYIYIYMYIFMYDYASTQGRTGPQFEPKGAIPGPGPQGPRGAHKGPAREGPGGPTRAQLTRAQGGRMGPAGKGPGGPTRAWPRRATNEK